MTNAHSMSVFIGRFQPPHKAHIETIRIALSKTQKCLVLIGSAFKAQDIKNPWTHREREEMIKNCFDSQEQKRLIFGYISDNPYNELAWIKDVQREVDRAYYDNFGWQDKSDISLIGHHKDSSSYYLDMFPSFKQIEVENLYGMDATTIRDLYFQGKEAWKHENYKKVQHFIPFYVMNWINNFMMNNARYNKLRTEYEFIRNYKLQWSQSPYPPTFVASDAVVTCLGHVLLVQRKAAPGEGLWAMPGGFVDQYETVQDSVIRELREETGIKVPAPVLKGSIRKDKRYDYPGRSTRGRTITTAFHIELHDASLPKVKGGDDAAKAKWFPLSEFIKMQDKMYEDHYHIVTDLLGLG